jgi:hypothetical protein
MSTLSPGKDLTARNSTFVEAGLPAQLDREIIEVLAQSLANIVKHRRR